MTLGRKASLGDKKVSSELDMLSSRYLWNTGGKECGWLELHGRGSLMSVYGVKAMVFPLVTYGCEGWTIKKAECPNIDTFEL